MTIAIFGREFDSSNAEKLRLLLVELASGGASLSYFRPFFDLLPADLKSMLPAGGSFSRCAELPADCGCLLSLGGDGTFLSSLTLVRNSGIPVAGINFGRLGFLTTAKAEEGGNPWIEDLTSGRCHILDRTVLKVSGLPASDGFYPYAVNEAVIQRRDPVMIAIDVRVDGELLPTYWADGLLIATPTGSTAYSLSIGGPIVRPDANILIISPIAPHNLNVRPLIVPDSSKIDVTFNSRGGEAILTMDNRLVNVSSGETLSFRKAGFKIKSAEFGNSNFIWALQEKLFWGEDKRNGRK